nr:ankyrin repeat domain-containing protein [Candidatus Cloacimonadota bacterium]
NVKAKDNITPLHSAAVKGNLDTVEVLISNGADVQASSSKDGSTPEDFARREGNQSVVDLLSR